jgi:archaellum component FlaC
MTIDVDKAVWAHIRQVDSLNRKHQIENQVKRLEQDMEVVKDRVEVVESKTAQEFYDELRNNVIEEVAQHIEKLTGFGKDTVDGLTIYIRGLKK